MSLHVSYMGTKRSLAPEIAKLVQSEATGPVLDAFAGVCTLAENLSPKTPVWFNDAQHFSNLVARAMYGSASGPTVAESAWRALHGHYCQQFGTLMRAFDQTIKKEDSVLLRGDDLELRRLQQASSDVISTRLINERFHALRKRRKPVYELFSVAYGNKYFSTRQTVEIDSIRYAIDAAVQRRQITRAQRLWCLLALCQVAAKCACTTGHFAQFLTANPNNLSYLSAKRARSICEEWKQHVNSLEPFGTASWRQRNKFFVTDAIELIASKTLKEDPPSLVYADPPYTKDQYSRYYHIFETLIRYDYPMIGGKAGYRAGRFTSGFSLRGRVFTSFDGLLKGIAETGASVVLSYPEVGLLGDSRSTIIKMGRKYFRRFQLSKAINYSHSTMGASKGFERKKVKELLFVGV